MCLTRMKKLSIVDGLKVQPSALKWKKRKYYDYQSAESNFTFLGKAYECLNTDATYCLYRY